MEAQRTDLAYERYSEEKEKGLFAEERTIGPCRLHILEVPTESGDIPSGRHLTLFFPKEDLLPFDAKETLSQVLFSLLSEESMRLCEKKHEGMRVLFTGLGNASATVDSFGPAAASRIRPTAHLKKEVPSLFSLLSAAELAVFSPGVSSESGIESYLLLHAAIECFRPELLLVADSLVAKTPAHLGRTLQISDAGIRPGSGLRAHTVAIDEDFAGCPVLSVGMPTAVAGETLLSEGKRKTGGFPTGHFFAPIGVDAAIEEGAAALGAAVERLFGMPH